MTTQRTGVESRPGRETEELTRSEAIGLSLVLGVLIGCCIGVSEESEYLHYRSVPREQAVVADWTYGPDTIHCRRSDVQEVLVTYRVDSPRPNFPAEFAISTCPGAVRPIGQQVTIARKDAAAQPDVEINPPESQWDVVGVSGLTGAGMFGLGLSLQLVRAGILKIARRLRPRL